MAALARLRLQSPSIWRTLVPQWRAFASAAGGDSSGGGSDGSGNDENKGKPGEDDVGAMFDLDDFLTADSDAMQREEEEEKAKGLEKVTKAMQSLEEEGMKKDEITPEMANELVNRIVDSTTTVLSSAESKSMASHLVQPYITKHTIEVMKASRLASHHVFAAGSRESEYAYPIAREVVGYLNLSQLNLSKAARQALVLIAGKDKLHYQLQSKKITRRRLAPFQRYDPDKEDDDYQHFLHESEKTNVRVMCDKFPTREENKAWIISRFDSLVTEAKKAVGENVDDTPLDDWNDVVSEVQIKAADHIKQSGGDVNHLLCTNV